jgi:predicted nucleotidyltransferase component of viral defense system
MIDQKSLSAEWIREQKRGQLSEEIIEKACRSLFLVEKMAAEGIDFVFKGGSCMMLFFDPPKRFSTDIDLFISSQEKDRLLSWLKRFTSNDLYYNPAPDVRGNEQRLHMAHYKVNYHSTVLKKESTLVLDLLFDRPPYKNLEKGAIKCSFLKLDNNPSPLINHPSSNDLLADKLTAFAPNTCGLLYRDKRSLDILKQLYDVAQLASLEKDLDYVEIGHLYQDIAQDEIEKRTNCQGKTPDDCLKDTIDASACALCGEDVQDSYYGTLTYSVGELSNYIQDYTTVTLIKTAAVVFRLALILYSGSLEEYQNIIELASDGKSITDVLPLSPKRIRMLRIDLKENYEKLEEAIRVYGFYFS